MYDQDTMDARFRLGDVPWPHTVSGGGGLMDIVFTLKKIANRPTPLAPKCKLVAYYPPFQKIKNPSPCLVQTFFIVFHLLDSSPQPFLQGN